MDLDRRRALLNALLNSMGDKDLLQSLKVPEEGLESNDPLVVGANDGIDRLTSGHDDFSEGEADGLEAIIMPTLRPVAFIDGGKYPSLEDPWGHLNDTSVRAGLEPLFKSVGRVELADSYPAPYGGTGFVVGDGLLMTNRHVAAIFTGGLGRRELVFSPGDSGIDFSAERLAVANHVPATVLDVKEVVMIHPFWDMALLRVEGLPADSKPLTLTTEPVDDLVGREIVVVGYPARDIRNDGGLQDRIFQRTYNVKRLQPGKLRPRSNTKSFGKMVSALAHDSSTLGGNSGSALIDPKSGKIVGLHFAGIYLKSNYAVPATELARDPRLREVGVRFDGPGAAEDPDVAAAWRTIEPDAPTLLGVVTPEVKPPPVATDPVVKTVKEPEVGAPVQAAISVEVRVVVGQPVIRVDSGDSLVDD